jgi:hypothetical protein
MDKLKKKYPKLAEAIVKIFAVMGLVIIILIAVYGAMAALRSIPNVWQAMGNAFSSVTSVFDRERNLSISANPSSPTTGEQVLLSWNNNTEGTYSFSFDCVDGVNFELLTETNSKLFAFCGVPVNFETSSNEIRVVPTLTGKSIETATVHINFTARSSEKITSTGSTNLSIINSSVAEVPPTDNGPSSGTGTSGSGTSGGSSTGTGTSGQTNQGSTSQVLIPAQTVAPLYGLPDLAVRILDIGTIDKNSNLYTPNANIKTTDRVAIRFEIINEGTNITGTWSFNATLPIREAFQFVSAPQQSLRPGDRIQYVLGFDNIAQINVAQITINVDPYNTVMESNEFNNIASRSVPVSIVPQAPQIEIQGGYCYIMNNGSYTCVSNNITYQNCHFAGDSYKCYGTNTTNQASTVYLPLNTSCYYNYSTGYYTCYSTSYGTLNECNLTNSNYSCKLY